MISNSNLHISKYVYLIATVLLILWIFLPSYRTRFDLVFLTLLELFYTLLFINNSISKLKKIALPLICYGLMNFAFALPGNFKIGFLHPIMTVWIAIFPMIMAYDVIKKKNIKEIKTEYFISLVFLFIILVATLKAMDENPYIMRFMTAGSASDEDDLANLSAQNVGGFGVAYGVGAIFISFFGVLLSYRLNLMVRIICVCIIIMLGYVIIYAQFTTLLILVFSILLYQLVKLKDDLLYKIFIILIGIVLFMLSEHIFIMLMDFFYGTKTGEHLNEIYGALWGDEEYDNFRRTLLSRAIDLFFQSPLIGSDVSIPDNMTVARQCHSTILYILIRVGLIGYSFFLYTYWMVFKPIFEYFNTKVRKLVLIPLAIYYLVLSYLNPIESDVFNFCFGFLALVTPYIISLYSKYGKKSKALVK